MSDLISRKALDAGMQKAQEYLESNSDPVWGLNKGHHAGLAWARKLCAEAPAVDATPVVHARWKRHDEDWRHQIAGNECSACGLVLYGVVGSYCSRCGAKMDGGADKNG